MTARDAEIAVAAAQGALERVTAERDGLRDENTDLHLVAQGIKHYWRCPKHFAGDPDGGECLRCRAEAAEAEVEKLKENSKHAWETWKSRAEAAEAEVARLKRISKVGQLEAERDGLRDTVRGLEFSRKVEVQELKAAEAEVARLNTMVQQITRERVKQCARAEAAEAEVEKLKSGYVAYVASTEKMAAIAEAEVAAYVESYDLLAKQGKADQEKLERVKKEVRRYPKHSEGFRAAMSYIRAALAEGE